MGSIQISSMSWERSGKPGRFSFFPKGALTHHPEGAVVFPAEIVRSPRGNGQRTVSAESGQGESLWLSTIAAQRSSAAAQADPSSQLLHIGREQNCWTRKPASCTTTPTKEG